MRKALIVEDDLNVVELLSTTLRKEGFFVGFAHDGNQALEKAQNSTYDLIVLDIKIPVKDGFEVCRSIRVRDSLTKIIVLTAQTDISSKVRAFDLGVNDYLTKPFSLEELKARIRNLTRVENIIRYGDLIVDKKSRVVIYNEQIIPFRKKEFDLLVFLLEHKNQVVSRDSIIDAVWVDCEIPYLNTIDVHIKRLRSKLENNINSLAIKTVHGIGYQLELGF